MTSSAPIEKSWWIYTRFSDDMQSSRSCDDQERECQQTGSRYGLAPIQSDRDEAVRAGAVAGRDGWNRIMAKARSGRVLGIIFEDLSRISRDFFRGMSDMAELQALRIKVADTKIGPIDLNSQLGQMYLAMGLATSQQETQRLGERSKRGLKGKTLERFSSGGRPAYGLQRVALFSETLLDPDGRPKRIGVRLEPHPVESLIVLRIFMMFDEGSNKHQIARRLNEEGVPTRDAGRSRRSGNQGPRPNSGTWGASSIKDILDNPIYRGVRVWNRNSRTGAKLPMSGKKQLRPNEIGEWIEVPGFCAAIVDEGLWERVQLRLKAIGERYKKDGIANQHGQYLLSGLIRCGSCGAGFVIGLRKKGVRQYRCGFRASRGTVACTNTVTVPQPALEARVRDVLDVVVKDPKKLAALVADHNRRISDANAGQFAVVRALTARQAKLVEERDRFVEAIGIGTGATKVLVAQIEKREKEIEELAKRISEAEVLVQPLLLPRPAAVHDYIAGPASLFENDLAHDKEFLSRVLEGIFVHADGTISLRFQGASLFAPVVSCRLDAEASASPLPAARREHQKLAVALLRDVKASKERGTAPHLHVVENAASGVTYVATREVFGDASFEPSPSAGPGGGGNNIVGVPDGTSTIFPTCERSALQNNVGVPTRTNLEPRSFSMRQRHEVISPATRGRCRSGQQRSPFRAAARGICQAQRRPDHRSRPRDRKPSLSSCARDSSPSRARARRPHSTVQGRLRRGDSCQTQGRCRQGSRNS